MIRNHQAVQSTGGSSQGGTVRAERPTDVLLPIFLWFNPEPFQRRSVAGGEGP